MDARSNNSRSNLGVWRWVAALGVALSLAVAPAGAAGAGQPAQSADSFVDSIGVNTHTSFDDTPYVSDFSLVKQRLVELGVRHIREDLVPDREDQYQRLDELAGIGVKSTLILGDPDKGIAGLEELISVVRNRIRGAVEAVEGPNEFDSRGGSDWAARLSEYQRQLYSTIKSDPSLAALPVLGPSIVQKRNEEAFGDISSSLDFGNVHPYPNGASPESNVSAYLARAALNSGSKPVMATETGFNTALATSEEHRPVSEEAMATYMPRLFLEYFRRGVARTYSYELLDEFSDPGHSEIESNFGLLRHDLSEKPAFTALRNTIDLLQDPGAAFTPGSLDYTLDGKRANLQDLLLQKRDGTFYLVLWRATSIWEPDSRTNVPDSPEPVTVELKRLVDSAVEYMPNASTDPVATLPAGTNRLTVEVGAQAVVLAIAPGATFKPGRIKVWVPRHSVRAGGRVAVRGRLPKQLTGHSTPVRFQQWQRGRGWRTIGRGRTRKSGVFKKKLRIPAKGAGRASRLRAIASVAKPSRSVRLQIR